MLEGQFIHLWRAVCVFSSQIPQKHCLELSVFSPTQSAWETGHYQSS